MLWLILSVSICTETDDFLGVLHEAEAESDEQCMCGMLPFCRSHARDQCRKIGITCRKILPKDSKRQQL